MSEQNIKFLLKGNKIFGSLMLFPFGKRYVSNKNDLNYGKISLDKSIDELTDNDNIICRTGYNKKQGITLRVLDLKIEEELKVEEREAALNQFLRISISHNLEHILIVETPSKNYHIYYLFNDTSDFEKIVLEEDSLHNSIRVNKINNIKIMAEKQFVYFPPTTFNNGGSYLFRFINSNEYINNNNDFLKLIKDVSNNPHIFENNRILYLNDDTRINLSDMREAFFDIIIGKNDLMKYDEIKRKRILKYLLLEFYTKTLLHPRMLFEKISHYEWFNEDLMGGIIKEINIEGKMEAIEDDLYYRIFPEYDKAMYYNTFWNDRYLPDEIYDEFWRKIERKNDGYLYEQYTLYYGKIDKNDSEKYGIPPRKAILKEYEYIAMYLECTRLENNGCCKFVYLDPINCFAVCNNGKWIITTENDLRVELNKIASRYLPRAELPIIRNAIDFYKQRNTVFRKSENEDFTMFNIKKYKDRIYFRNGQLIIDFEKKRFEFVNKINPRDFIFYTTLIDYNPNKECPRFERFINEVLDGHSEENKPFLKKLLLSFLADSLIPGNNLEWFLMILGTGRNGKGTLMNTMSKIVQSNTIRISGWNYIYGSETSINSYISWIPEIDANINQMIALIKTVSGRDPFTVQIKFKPQICLPEAPFKFVITPNETYEFAKESDPIWKRAIVIEFLNSFIGEKEDVNLKDVLINEIEGIVNYLLPYIFERAEIKKEYYTIYNPYELYNSYNSKNLFGFLDNAIIPSETGKVSYIMLYKYYQAYCKLEKENISMPYNNYNEFCVNIRKYFQYRRNFIRYKEKQSIKTYMFDELQKYKYSAGAQGVSLNYIYLFNFRNKLAERYEKRGSAVPQEIKLFIPYLEPRMKDLIMAYQGDEDIIETIQQMKEHNLAKIWDERDSMVNVENMVMMIIGGFGKVTPEKNSLIDIIMNELRVDKKEVDNILEILKSKNMIIEENNMIIMNN